MHVHLPVASTEVEDEVITGEMRPLEAGRTVLLVEDEAALRELIERFLRGEGYRVLAAADGSEALALFEREGGAVDLVVTDMLMPGRSGIELMAEIDARTPGTIVLFMSGYAFDGASILTSRPGSAFIAKPFTLPILGERIAALLGSSARSVT